MSANTEKFLPPPGHHGPRRTMWRYIHVSGGAVIGLVVAACADNPAAPVAGPEATARSQTGIHGPSTAADFDPGVPLAYYQRSLTYTKQTAGFTPPVQARAFGYMGLALYESVIKGMPDHRSVASQLNGVGALPQANGIPYNWALVANAAMAEVMRGLWGDQTNKAAANTADLSALEDSLASVYSVGVPPGIAKLSSDFGRSVGAAVFATSRDDGGDRSYLTNFPTSYTPPVGPGFWVPAPSTQVAMQPYWATTVGTLALSNAAQCSPGPPPAYSEDHNSQFYSEANYDYQLSQNLTQEQRTIAQYWADGPGTISGPGHALAIVGEIVMQQHANLAQAAEAYARAGIADADALTGIWQTKYQYNLIRPITYIQRVIDQSWSPLLPTPPFPEYVSAHSGQSAAVAATLEALFGTNVPFVDHAHDADGFASRSFDHIFAAAEEAGISRLYAGIHFQSGNLNGRALGQCVAARVNSLNWRR
ncbi:MAG: vanadium-dependent haloperoxidase [Gemmatimonadaceae bacterium]